MPAKKRAPLQIEKDRAEIEWRYLRNETQASIAARLGLTQQQISYDLAVVEDRWRERALDDRQKRKAQELARIDHLERVYWAAWERSCGDVPPLDEAYPGEADLLLAQLEKRGGRKTAPLPLVDPDPRYLQGVQWCIGERCKLLGHYAPVQSLSASVVMRLDVRTLSDDQLDALADGDFAGLASGDDGAGETPALLEGTG